jgi:hypothetical protein
MSNTVKAARFRRGTANADTVQSTAGAR